MYVKNTRNNFAYLVVFTTLSCLIAFWTNPIYAISETIVDNPTCKTIGGIWNTHTCTFLSLKINSSDTLTIPSGITITIPIDALVFNLGIINNTGLILNQGVFENLQNDSLGGTINNFGKIENVGILENHALLINEITQYSQGDFVTIHGSTLQNRGIINNSGKIEGDATMENFGIINNLHNATLNNTDAEINNNIEAIINNYGFLGSNLSGFITNKGILNNFGSLVLHTTGTHSSIANYGTLNNSCQSRFNSSGITIGNPLNKIPCNHMN